MGVDEPDYGHLLDDMVHTESNPIDISRYCYPRIEVEIGYVLGAALPGEGCTEDDVLAATEYVVPSLELIDSRIRDWRIGLADTIADNASAGMFVLGGGTSPARFDFEGCGMVLEKNGVEVGRGKGAASMGSPRVAMAWLANTLGARGLPLRAGEIVLSGSLGPLVPVVAGDRLRVSIEGLGAATVSFE